MSKKPNNERISYSRLKEPMSLPYLVEIQTGSYSKFLQEHVLPEEREDMGLQAVFSGVFPIKNYDESRTLEFVKYKLGVPKYDELECMRRGMTYEMPLKVTFRLHQGGHVEEEEVYMGNLPGMTSSGTFVINGVERVVVSQLHRSPGICYEQEVHTRGHILFSFKIIPYRGSWLEVKFDQNDLIYIFLDRSTRRKKILATTFLRALGYGTNEELLNYFFQTEEVKITSKISEKELEGKILARNVIDEDAKITLAKAGSSLNSKLFKMFQDGEVKSIFLLKGAAENHPVLKMIKKDSTSSKDEALIDIFKRLRPGDPVNKANVEGMIQRLFSDKKRYDLGRVGRFKLNNKLGLPLTEEGLSATTLDNRDIAEAIRYLIALRDGVGHIDDIDHLGNRRVRSVGELLENQFRAGLVRMERLIKEKMTLHDIDAEDRLVPHKLVSPKSLSSVIKEFFGRSQLSQFMDQTNPLAELAHKRRLSALGPGGLSRERAGFEVRDIHPSHYGRICPIQTPEGPNIGLISYLSAYARVNEYGFVETPYCKVENGRVTDKIDYLAADEETECVIAQANASVDSKGKFVNDGVLARCKGEFGTIEASKVDYMDVSPKQLISIAAGLIPFLEHDDANRALMGSNMQRQAVPLLSTDQPLVATGLESKSAKDSGVLVVAEESGVITYVDATEIYIGNKVYYLRKYLRSNAGTCFNQKPIVKKGDKVVKGQVIADGPGTRGGELALGRNVLCAFMPWGGYNFEDAILISEKIVKEDIYTSIHIEEFDVSARETKIGKEEITRDIPNIGEEALKDLGEDGIVRIGAEVRAGNILVGKITPKSETELLPEEKLLRAIFGEKAADVRDTSLRIPSGTEGIVMDVKVFSRKERPRTDVQKKEERRLVKAISNNKAEKISQVNKGKSEELNNLLLGKTIKSDVVNINTGEVIIQAGKKIVKNHVNKLEDLNYSELDITEEDIKIRSQIKKLLAKYDYLIEKFETEEERELERLKKGDELEPGVIKQVKVYIASKRKLEVGDKMAGRHGNKGVIAKILPEEDMPFLEDGTPLEIILNPLGVPSRMNVGQVLETHLGWAAAMLGIKIMTPVFDGADQTDISKKLKQANLPEDGKTVLYDGCTGEKFDQKIVVGYIYMMKLAHLVADKIHARAVGPYSLVTQQPLGGKAQFGGQRFGEMEVWALEAYGAAYALQELLTVKSDDVAGRTKIYESIVKGNNRLEAGTPESFNVLIKEMQALCLDVVLQKNSEQETGGQS